MPLAHDLLGDGAPTVLFVHAFPFDRRMWRRQAEAVAGAGARALVVDLRGFGGSLDATPPASIDAHADALAAFLDARAIDRAIVVGLSMGGYVALALARRHPVRVQGLVLADTKATADDEAARAARETNIARVRKEGPGALFDAMRANLFAPNTPASTVEAMRAIAAAQPVEGTIAALAAMRDRPDSTPTLSSIRVPTRVIVGAADAVTPLADARAMSERVPGADLVEIPEAGHLSSVERPDVFDGALLSFLQRVGR